MRKLNRLGGIALSLTAVALLSGAVGLNSIMERVERGDRGIASLPPQGPPQGGRLEESALVQPLSEIRVAKEAELNFDGDLARLAKLENRYNENLPLLRKNARVAGPTKRIENRKYRYSRKRWR